LGVFTPKRSLLKTLAPFGANPGYGRCVFWVRLK